MSKQEAPTTPLEGTGGDATIPIKEGPVASVPIATIITKPLGTGPTTPGGGAHDEGNPGAEEAWTTTIVSRDTT